MKVTDVCSNCEKRGRKVTVDVSPSDRDAFITFAEQVQRDMAARNDPKAAHLFIPPAKYPKQQLVIPGPGENPCQHCKYGADNIGPTGCGRGNTCLPLYYFRIFQLDSSTAAPSSTSALLSEFLCTVPNATLLYPTKKIRASSAAEKSALQQKISSVADQLQSLKSTDAHKSKWPKSSKQPSKSKLRPSSKRALVRAKRSRT